MLTTMIPTKNRSDFLIRLLNYYADTDYKYWICIGDSSNTEHVEQTKKAIRKLERKLKIMYREYPHTSEPECTRQLLQSVSTPYVAWVADDDFLVSDGLACCINFLETHPDYTVALGKAVLLTLNESGAYGQISNVGSYNLRSIEAESARQRIMDHLNNYSNPNFGVHRIEKFRKAYSAVLSLPDKGFTEMLPNCMSCIEGKVRQLGCFYLVRQNHDRRYLLPGTYDWITNPNWFPSYQVFSSCLVEELVKQDGITMDESREVVKQAFWAYLNRALHRKFQERYGREETSGIWLRMKKALKGTPGVSEYLLPVWRGIKSSLFHSDEISLQALLKPSSPYHKDFMPIYHAITENEIHSKD